LIDKPFAVRENRMIISAIAALTLPLAAAQVEPATSAQAPESFRLDQLADPTITKAIEEGVIDVAPTGEIIVQGTTEKEIRNFVWRAITPMSGRKIAVRSDPVCMSFDNIDETLEAALRQRIAENLATVGRELAGPGCKPNAAVAFPRNAHLFMRWLDSNKRRIFDAMYEPERRRHVRPRRVAYNWHFVPEKAMMRESQRGGEFGMGLAGLLQSIDSRLTSQLGTDTISHSFTVIEASAIDGVSPLQLADYITMHVLVMFEPGVRPEVPPGSILRLFDKDGANEAAPDEMSAVDRVVLSTLYRSGRSFFNAGLMRAEIARNAMKDKP
jgi:hypothetical protein